MSTEFKMPGGGTIIVNNPSMVDEVAQGIQKFNMECLEFHQKLMSLGVKAYRCNDGWVDRHHHNVTFFSSEKEHGYYWGNMNLQSGDMIFIGNAYNGGHFATIENVIDRGYGIVTYHYNLIEPHIKTCHVQPKTNHQRNTRILSSIQKILTIIGKLFNRKMGV